MAAPDVGLLLSAAGQSRQHQAIPQASLGKTSSVSILTAPSCTVLHRPSHPGCMSPPGHKKPSYQAQGMYLLVSRWRWASPVPLISPFAAFKRQVRSTHHLAHVPRSTWLATSWRQSVPSAHSTTGNLSPPPRFPVFTGWSAGHIRSSITVRSNH
jgi:hypothetical protein